MDRVCQERYVMPILEDGSTIDLIDLFSSNYDSLAEIFYFDVDRNKSFANSFSADDTNQFPYHLFFRNRFRVPRNLIERKI